MTTTCPRKVRIVITQDATGQIFSLLGVDGQRIRDGVSSKELSIWAMTHGAFEVRHDYDLRLER